MYPEGETGVFSVMSSQWYNVGNPAESDVTQETTVHVDQYSGEKVGQYSYADYSAMAKVVSHGIALHEGRRLGVANEILSTLFCLAVIFMCVTGPMMWWTRRGTASGMAAPRGNFRSGQLAPARRDGRPRRVPAPVRSVAAGDPRTGPTPDSPGAGTQELLRYGVNLGDGPA